MPAPLPRILLVAFLAASVSVCSGTTEVEEPVPTSLSVSPASIQLGYVGQSFTLTASVQDQDGDPVSVALAWATTDPGVATVDASGVVRAVANGTTTVTVAVGDLFAEVRVVVEQVPSRVSVLAGDGQDGVAGAQLPDTVVVRVADQGGAVVVGADIDFVPEPGAGTVNVSSTISDADGEGRVVWTLGDAYGPQSLTVSTVGGSTAVTAFSFSDTPTPDLYFASSLTSTPANPTTVDSVRVVSRVGNQGNLASGPFQVQVLVQGAEAGVVEHPGLSRDEEAEIALTLPPPPSGTVELAMVIDPADAVDELIETNNRVERSVSVEALTILAPGASVPGLSGAEGEEMLFRVDVEEGTTESLTIELNGGSGDVDLYVSRRSRPAFRTLYDDCGGWGLTPGADERCQIAFPAGQHYVLIHAFTDFSGATMTVTLDEPLDPYDIEVLFRGSPSTQVQTAAQAAARRWEEVIVADVWDVDFRAPNTLDVSTCVPGVVLDDVVDDLRIYVTEDSIDGSFGTLAQAGWCVGRPDVFGSLPVFGRIQVDRADASILGASDLEAVLLHEMGHVLGIGTSWNIKNLIREPSLSSPGADTHFTGPWAIDAFDAAGGAGYDGSKVPVENSGTEGSADAHWRELVMGIELMTPAANSGRNPLSRITIRSLTDLGYGVDPAQADAYSVPLPLPARVEGAPEPLLDFRGDVLRLPVLTGGSGFKTRGGRR